MKWNNNNDKKEEEEEKEKEKEIPSRWIPSFSSFFFLFLPFSSLISFASSLYNWLPVTFRSIGFNWQQKSCVWLIARIQPANRSDLNRWNSSRNTGDSNRSNSRWIEGTVKSLNISSQSVIFDHKSIILFSSTDHKYIFENYTYKNHCNWQWNWIE